MINLDELFFQAYTRGATDKSVLFSKDQLRSFLFSEVPFIGKVQTAEIETEKTEKTKKAKTVKANKLETETDSDSDEKKTRKPRKTADDEVRCHARTFNEKEHLENGKPKIVNADDENNLYGGRCSSKKNGESDFCKMHCEKQAHGIWDGAYGDKCNKYLDEPEKETKPKKAIVKKTVAVAADAAEPKKLNKKEAKVETDNRDNTEKENKAEKEDKAIVKTAAKKKLNKKAAKIETADEDNEDDDTEEHDDDEYISSVNKLEEAKVEYDWVEIDGEDYMIDGEGNVYDPDSEEKIGNYNTKTKKWISGGPTADDE